jgi:hypothetical protein
MTDPTHLLEIVLSNTVLRAPFRSRRAAVRNLNLMKKKMGWRLNDPKSETHTLKTEFGESVIRMKDVISISAVDAVNYIKALDGLHEKARQKTDGPGGKDIKL